jgi:hypothetical protein
MEVGIYPCQRLYYSNVIPGERWPTCVLAVTLLCGLDSSMSLV